jgi:hypothetical protein
MLKNHRWGPLEKCIIDVNGGFEAWEELETVWRQKQNGFWLILCDRNKKKSGFRIAIKRKVGFRIA